MSVQSSTSMSAGSPARPSDTNRSWVALSPAGAVGLGSPPPQANAVISKTDHGDNGDSHPKFGVQDMGSLLVLRRPSGAVSVDDVRRSGYEIPSSPNHGILNRCEYTDRGASCDRR